uniref:phenylalanine--tRNA ligase n=1 Tax=Chondria tumulosa TaxID=2740715 RepID=A0A896SVB2_9FLOR|nr:phenylalanine-tRNA ligase beta subunit [Chondria tumulosa]QSD57195.1 phenylalanine-tRNA ligase beta subunit [Chondria tumulosa]
MKFSWKLINNFIKLQDIDLSRLEKQLILSGIEIENIENRTKVEEIIFDISITTNRKEIHSTINLAKEISIIFNKPLKVSNIIFFTRSIKQTINKSYSNNNKLINISINRIKNIQISNIIIPKWIKEYSDINNINEKDPISYIQNYIKVKWGQKFYILNKNELVNKLSHINENQTKNIVMNENDNNKFLFFTTQNINHNEKTKIEINYSDYYFNAYIDTLKVISTFTKCIIGNCHHIYDDKNYYSKQIIVNKNIINTTLGQTKKKKFAYLSSQKIVHILNQLQLFPKYNKILETFSVKVPIVREHDLNREIDIIEEIGRIKGFNNFINKIPKNNKKGKIYKISLQIKNIRKILRQLGMNEVINCCLIKNYLSGENIKLSNPITREQTELRNSIIQNLINTYISNKKELNTQEIIEIFEIGKIFSEKSYKRYSEELCVGGLIDNNKFIQNNWSSKGNDGNFFHFKAFIEFFLEQLHAKIEFKKLSKKIHNNETKNIKNFFHKAKHIGIYNPNKQELIGILGEINPIYTKKIKTSKNKIYIFEINIRKLNESIYFNNHLNYITKTYSYYPSVTRDITIKVNKQTNIKIIRKIFLRVDNALIKSVEIFNEYIDKESSTRSISLRVTYKSNTRTLNNKDIQNIDIQVNNLLSKFMSKT